MRREFISFCLLAWHEVACRTIPEKLIGAAVKRLERITGKDQHVSAAMDLIYASEIQRVLFSQLSVLETMSPVGWAAADLLQALTPLSAARLPGLPGFVVSSIRLSECAVSLAGGTFVAVQWGAPDVLVRTNSG